MYTLLNEMSNLLNRPFLNMANNAEAIPIIGALALGLVGALAPCQISGNISAITLYGNRALQKSINWIEILLFTLGKVIVFSALGFIVWLLGNEVKPMLIQVFPWIRKTMGPLMIIVGLFMIGVIKIRWNNPQIRVFTKKSRLGSFLMGATFALAFCPTMFVLFFVSLMPLVLSTSYGAILPGIFAIGTSFPLILFVTFIWFFGFDGTLLKRGRKIGAHVQKAAGVFMIFLGLLDIFTYW
ncbi:cytochrome C biosynthesis protein [Bacillus sp. FJAT-27231]|uniref:urease accessory protein UreH domain-containing protein n=1 Tax=Bacillus sp. FJAT-27231 TaxID=1679168 RepID=UPI000671179C|nr:sulfite exporter TauE/SafE family protein [Bacillus sp. FJAT-27231]KMY52520.1 cytochrome C biosynthesis protein [Bacillus sp. FJAT-27231]